MQFESKGKEEFVDLKAELLVEGSLERWKYEREMEWQEVRKKEEQSRLNDGPAPPSKCLYEQLKERQEQREAEREQKRSLKNYLYTGPNDEEIELIQCISSNEAEQRMLIEREERLKLEEFRKNMEIMRREENERIEHEDSFTAESNVSSTSSQKKSLMSSVVVRPKRKTKKKIVEEKKTRKHQKQPDPHVTPPAKRPALVSYSSDSETERDRMKQK
ncbi:hypothetical protein LOD99_2306 [Oopsacas minuta]|uniref:FAM192A/Fyv6 N-terminal domain-containing protein n=1 Tax=Oopsacas minuta TaxID=111878 RepID=A0AAV7K1I2_9METZ|nr:hypothetical protein LOD99_2306 [Oopsacas minuta]